MKYAIAMLKNELDLRTKTAELDQAIRALKCKREIDFIGFLVEEKYLRIPEVLD